jgi:hypothetical protein
MTSLRLLLLPTHRLLLALLGVALVVAAARPPTVAAADWKERATRYVVILHQQDQANIADQLAGVADPIVEQLAALHDYTVSRPFTVRLYGAADAYAQSSDLARTPFGQIAQANLKDKELAIAGPRLANLSPEQHRNLFRRGLSELMLDDITRGRMPIGLLHGVAQYSESPTPEVEVGARALDKARRDRAMLSWADLNAPDRFAAQSEIAAAESYSIVAFLLDRYGLAPWQRFIAATRAAPDGMRALEQGYGKPAATLESEWQAYLPEYFGGSYRINYFARYDLGVVREHLQGGRYLEARDELEALARWVAGAGRAAKETDLREMAKQVAQGMEAEALLSQGRTQMASFQYAPARDVFQQSKQRFEAIGAATKVEEVNTALASAESGVAAVDQLEQSKRLLTELKYPEAREAAMAAIRVFAGLSDEERYRQSYLIIQELDGNLTRIAYLLGALALGNVVWAAWRLTAQARRRALPGVLQ